VRDDVASMSEREDKPAGEVLSSLPSARPQRRSARRDGASAKRAPAKRAAPKGAKASRGRASTARSRQGARTGGRRPTGVRPSAATRAASSTPTTRPAEAPEGIVLVGTAIQAAGELAQLGLVLGTKALRGAVARLPRP
jgi:hypothetical protein